MQLSQRRKYIDKTFWFLYLSLIAFAVVALFSAGSSLVYSSDEGTLGPITRQIGFLAFGVVAAYLIQYVDSKYITYAGYAIFLLSLILLYVMLIPGNRFVVRINGAARWFNLFGIKFQPSELAKLGLMIVMADLLTKPKNDEEARKCFYITLVLTVITCLPILFSNLSTTILIFGLVVLMWILGRVKWKYILTVIGVSVAFLVSGYCIVEFGYVRQGRSVKGVFSRANTWVSRVDAAIDEMKRPKGEFKINDKNYQRTLAKVAVMRGGKTPIGVGPGNSQERDYLPFAYEEYIFSIIVEESGLVGAIILIFIYLAILFRACYTSTKFRGDQRAMLTVMGLALMLTCQALLSMAVAVGLGPVTGQPLPLVSHGGTSVVATSLYFAVMLCVSREQEELHQRQMAAKIDSESDAPEITLN